MTQPEESKVLGYRIAWVDRTTEEEGCGDIWPPSELPTLVRMVDKYNDAGFFDGKEYFMVTVKKEDV